MATVTSSFTGVLQSWTVPAGVTQATIVASGAQGGNDPAPAGDGAEVGATFSVTPPETLNVLVAGQGGANLFGGGGGGGGGSFVYRSADQAGLLLAAAGGGGRAGNGGTSGGPGNATAGAADGGGGGGAGGVGGNGGGGSLCAGGGGGLLTDGGGGSLEDICRSGGGSLVDGGSGGSPGEPGGGGFGGGGGGGFDGGGGGGGYNGGGGAGFDGGGGGGGSFSAVTPTTANSGVQTGNGQVTISYTVPDTDLGIATHPNITTNATGANGATVNYTPPAASDEGGETPSVGCVPASGSTFVIGTTTVTCTASDSDDTPSTAQSTFTVTVKGALAQLQDLLASVTGLPPGESLPNKVKAAIATYQAGDTADTCSTLSALINEAKAQSGKKLTTTQANNIITTANRIRAVIGC